MGDQTNGLTSLSTDSVVKGIDPLPEIAPGNLDWQSEIKPTEQTTLRFTFTDTSLKSNPRLRLFKGSVAIIR